MKLSELRNELEKLVVEHSRESYRQLAGLDYSEKKIQEKANEIEELSKKALNELETSEIPRNLRWRLIGGAVSSRITELENEIYKKRMNEVKFREGKEKVNLGNWRTWNSKNALNHQKRKRVFDAIVQQGNKLAPLVEEGFKVVKENYGEHGLDVLGMYLEMEETSKKELLEVVKYSAKKAKGPFEKLSEELSPEVIGKQMEYYDDIYVYRHRIYRPFDETFKEIDYVKMLNEIFEDMGFNMDKVKIDAEQREGKTPSPMCASIKIPEDIRILYQETTPFGDFTSYCHEVGHALHGSSIKKEIPFEQKYIVPMGIAETFSTLFESLATDEVFLKEELGLSEDRVNEIKRRERFMELFFLTFYGANSQMKLEYWDKGYTIQEASQRYGELYDRYVGQKMPGKYWLVHHIMPLYTLYCPSYLIANIRKSELRNKLIKEFGRQWWGSRDAGRYLKEELMGPGSRIPLKEFSKMKKEIYLNEVLKE